MPPEERDAAYIWDMREAAREVIEMTAGVSLKQFLGNRMLLRATERSVEIIGEAARRVSDEFMDAHPEIPWRAIIGQRNILAHEYGHLDHEILYRTVVDEIPALTQKLDALLGSLDKS